MKKKLQMPGLYIIKSIVYEHRNDTDKEIVAVFDTVDSFSTRSRMFRINAARIATTPEKAKNCINYFLNTGLINADAKMSYYANPYGEKQNIVSASLDNVINKPCLVRYNYAGQNIPMLFIPHEFRF